jgi:hypothetical protein
LGVVEKIWVRLKELRRSAHGGNTGNTVMKKAALQMPGAGGRYAEGIVWKRANDRLG